MTTVRVYLPSLSRGEIATLPDGCGSTTKPASAAADPLDFRAFFAIAWAATQRPPAFTLRRLFDASAGWLARARVNARAAQARRMARGFIGGSLVQSVAARVLPRGRQ